MKKTGKSLSELLKDFKDYPQAELERKEDEQSNSMKKAMNQALPDYLKAGVDNDEENSEE